MPGAEIRRAPAFSWSLRLAWAAAVAMPWSATLTPALAAAASLAVLAAGPSLWRALPCHQRGRRLRWDSSVAFEIAADQIEVASKTKIYRSFIVLYLKSRQAPAARIRHPRWLLLPRQSLAPEDFRRLKAWLRHRPPEAGLLDWQA